MLEALDIYAETKFTFLENNDGCSTHPHNTYLQIFTSNGIVGFSLLLFAFFYIVLEILKSRKKINLENNFNKYETSKTILLAIILVNLWPFAPSGNFLIIGYQCYIFINRTIFIFQI